MPNIHRIYMQQIMSTVRGLSLFVLVACSVYVSAFTPHSLTRPTTVSLKMASTIEPRTITDTTTSTGSLGDDAVSGTTQGMMDTPAFKFIDSLFSFRPFHDLLFGVYRDGVVKKAEKMGLQWTNYLKDMNSKFDSLQALKTSLTDPETVIPDYYYAPIHAYDDGNLCWDSAMEEDLFSKMMIAPLYDNALDGDERMRRVWLEGAFEHLSPEAKSSAATQGPLYSTDLGSGTGLSMVMSRDLVREVVWEGKPDRKIEMTGVDLSPYKLAVCKQKLNEEEEAGTCPPTSTINLIHAQAENNPVASNSQDFVTLCLVNHESPKDVSQNIFNEAARITKEGGIFTILDLDKNNLERLLVNPFVAAVYKRTEPYMADYLAFSFEEAIEAAPGLELVDVVQASPSHKAYVARKVEMPAVSPNSFKE